jgi:hypothetical protein
MRYLLQGLTLALAWFATVNAVASVIVVAASRRRWRAESPAFWLALRMCPAAASTMFVVAVFVPAYWRYEPVETVERLDVTLVGAAALAITLVMSASVRGVRAWRQTSQRVRSWMRTARPIALGGTSFPAFVVDGHTPVMALAGVLRPRLFVTRALVNALTRDELAASVAHEIGHFRAFDNLKRLAMCAAPDFLTFTEAARTLERRWASTAEHVADRMCDNATAAARYALASALVKVARLTPGAGTVAEPISTLIGCGEIASRVRRLLDDRATAAPPRVPWWPPIATLLVVATTYGPLLRAVHHVTELLVHALP